MKKWNHKEHIKSIMEQKLVKKGLIFEGDLIDFSKHLQRKQEIDNFDFDEIEVRPPKSIDEEIRDLLLKINEAEYTIHDFFLDNQFSNIMSKLVNDMKEIANRISDIRKKER